MNLLLLFDEDFAPDGTVELCDRRAKHAQEILKSEPGDTLRVGKWNGLTGEGRVLETTATSLRLSVRLDTPPPKKIGVSLLLAIPRPKALKKILPAVASLGVEKLVLVNAARVEKSYFASHVLAADTVREFITAGLEQAKDTVPPEVIVRERFRPFVEDELESVLGPGKKLVADPRGSEDSPAHDGQRLILAIGPDGGWVPFELELLQNLGFDAFSLGPRTLRSEVAVPFALGRLRC